MTDEITLGGPAATPAPVAAIPAAVEPAAPTPASATETEVAPADPAAEPPKPKREGGFQRRINELTYQREELRRQNERLLALAEQYAKPRNEPAQRPKLLDFPTMEEYEDARDAWRDGQKSAPKTPTTEPSKARSVVESQEFQAARADLLEDATDKYEDFEDLVTDPTLKISDTMAVFILESEQRVDLAYHLAKNPKEAARIAKLSPVRQAAELTRIEDKLIAPPTKRPSAAPAPIAPTKGIAADSSTEPDASKNYAAWLSWRRAQKKK